MYAVAQVSDHLEDLAQTAFEHSLDGRLDVPYSKLKRIYGVAAGKHRENINRVFGPVTKHAIFEEHFGLPVLWHHLDISRIRTMHINKSQLVTLRTSQPRFGQLTELQIRESSRYDIDFSSWFPALRKLKLSTHIFARDDAHLPRNLECLHYFSQNYRVSDDDIKRMLRQNPSLRELQLDRIPFHPANLIEFLHEVGISNTLESLIVDNPNQYLMGTHILPEALTQFERLKVLDLKVSTDFGGQANIETFASLQNLECLRISLKTSSFGWVQSNFLTHFAANAPPQLREITIYSNYKGTLSDWHAFEAALPTCNCSYERSVQFNGDDDFYNDDYDNDEYPMD